MAQNYEHVFRSKERGNEVHEEDHLAKEERIEFDEISLWRTFETASSFMGNNECASPVLSLYKRDMLSRECDNIFRVLERK